MLKRIIYPLFLVTAFTTTRQSAAQNILHLTKNDDIFFVKSGTQLALDRLVLVPGSDFVLRGNNDVVKSVSPVHPLTNPAISLFYQFASPTPPFTGAISLYYLDNELNGLAESSLTLNVYNGMSWNTYVAGLTRNTASNFVTTSGLSGLTLSELTLGTATMIPLAASFLAINTHCDAAGTIIRWTMANELNVLRYGIESSDDARNWKESGSITAAAAGNRETNYAFTDRNSGASQRYYRISEYDMNGKKTISSVLQSSCLANEVFNVYPNPVASKLFMSIGTTETTRATIKMYDATGVLVRMKVTQLLQGNNQLSLEVGGLPPGTYTVTGEWNNKLQQIKVVKK